MLWYTRAQKMHFHFICMYNAFGGSKKNLREWGSGNGLRDNFVLIILLVCFTSSGNVTSFIKWEPFTWIYCLNYVKFYIIYRSCLGVPCHILHNYVKRITTLCYVKLITSLRITLMRLQTTSMLCTRNNNIFIDTVNLYRFCTAVLLHSSPLSENWL